MKLFRTIYKRHVQILLLGLWLIISMYSMSSYSSENKMIQVIELATSMQCDENNGASIIFSKGDVKRESGDIQLLLGSSKIDWATHYLLKLNMGIKSNTGYFLKYQGGAYIDNMVLTVPVKWKSPQADGMYAQVMVNPCLILSIPRVGYKKIQILDDAGLTRWSIAPFEK
jgi:hypothetical protein